MLNFKRSAYTIKLCLFLAFAFWIMDLNAQWIYVDCNGLGIIKLNTSSKVIEPFLSTSIGTSDIAFTPDGSLYGIVATNNLYKIDTITGAMTFIKFISSSNTYIYGLASNYKGELITYGYDLTTGLGEIIILNLVNNTETKLGYTGHEGWDLDFLNGKLYGICGEFNNSSFYLLDINLSQPNTSTQVFPYLNFSPLGGASIYENCEGKLFGTRHMGLLEYDLVNSTVMETFVPGLLAPQGATSLTSWIGSLPPLAIDTVTSLIQNIGCGSLSNITIHARDRGISIEYSINGIDFQSDSIFTNKSPGKYHVFIRDTLGCTREDSITLDGIPVGYVEKIEVNDITCASSNGSISILAGFKEDILSYSIDGINYSTDTLFKNLSIGPGILYVTSSTGCHDTINYDIGSVPKSDFIVKSKDIDCHVSSGTVEIETEDDLLTFTLDGGSPQLHSIPWSGLSVGIHSIEIIDSNGCVSQDFVEIKNSPSPVLHIDAMINTCDSIGNITLTNINGGLVSFKLDNGPAQTSNVFSNVKVGLHQGIIIDAAGCSDTLSIQLLPYTFPIINISSKNENCSQSDGTITISPEGIGPFTYSIDLTNFQSSNTFDSLTAGTYNITAKDQNGCEVENEITIANESQLQVEKITTVNDICDSGKGSLKIKMTGNNPYLFKIGDGAYGNESVFNGLQKGIYQIGVKGDSGCVFDTLVELLNFNTMELTTASPNDANCGLSNGSLHIGASSDSPVLYNINNGAFQPESVFSNLPAGKYYMFGKNESGCSVDTVLYIENIGNITVNEIILKQADCGKNNGAVLISAFDNGENNLIFELNEFQNTTGVFNEIVAGEYLLTIKNEFECNVEKSLIIEQEPCELFVPNVFTPNYDGTNDLWEPNYDPSKITLTQALIYDRWGALVYSSNGGRALWNGEFKSKPCHPGVYVYWIEYRDMLSNKIFNKKGDFTIVR